MFQNPGAFLTVAGSSRGACISQAERKGSKYANLFISSLLANTLQVMLQKHDSAEHPVVFAWNMLGNNDRELIVLGVLHGICLVMIESLSCTCATAITGTTLQYSSCVRIGNLVSIWQSSTFQLLDIKHKLKNF